MRLKTLFAVAVAAAFAVPLSTQAQSDKPPSSASGASKDVPAKCAALTGADREKCLQEARSGAGASAPTSPTSPSPSPSTSGSGSGSAEPKKQ
jgi:hypothetical protein